MSQGGLDPADPDAVERTGPVEEVVLRAGAYQAAVTTTGATLRELICDGEPLLDGFAHGTAPDGARGQVLAPWPNRLRDGAWTWKGQRLHLPVDTPDKGNSASHGLVRLQRWTVHDAAVDRVDMRYRLRARPGYPFALDLRCTYELDARQGLLTVLSARAADGRRVPVALGAHPYLRPPGAADGAGAVDAARLSLPADSRVVVDGWGQPTGTEDVTGGPHDLRHGPPLGALQLNHAFTDLHRDVDGGVTVRLVTDARPWAVELRAGPTCRWLQVYTGDDLSGGAWRRAVAVEPMTAPAGALASGEGLTVLEPGEQLQLWWQVRRHDGT